MNSIQIRERKRGCPPKKDYDPESLMQELIDTVTEVYHNTNEIKATVIEISLPPHKVKKLLITGKVISYSETEQNDGRDRGYHGTQLFHNQYVSAIL